MSIFNLCFRIEYTWEVTFSKKNNVMTILMFYQLIIYLFRYRFLVIITNKNPPASVFTNKEEKQIFVSIRKQTA